MRELFACAGHNNEQLFMFSSLLFQQRLIPCSLISWNLFAPAAARREELKDRRPRASTANTAFADRGLLEIGLQTPSRVSSCRYSTFA